MLQSDVMYAAVLVPEGTHHIELTYRTPYLGTGLIVSGVTAFGLIGFYVIRRIRKRKAARSSDPSKEL